MTEAIKKQVLLTQ